MMGLVEARVERVLESLTLSVMDSRLLMALKCVFPLALYNYDSG
jgi:hypothetical protein